MSELLDCLSVWTRWDAQSSSLGCRSRLVIRYNWFTFNTDCFKSKAKKRIWKKRKINGRIYLKNPGPGLVCQLGSLVNQFEGLFSRLTEMSSIDFSEKRTAWKRGSYLPSLLWWASKSKSKRERESFVCASRLYWVVFFNMLHLDRLALASATGRKRNQ